jgi:hypothetical protein
MPEIARFYGIIIRIFYESGRHQLPHIHAAYGEYLASYSIDPPALLAGTMPRKQQNLVIAWIELHQEELLENWQLISQDSPPNKIEGLH